MSVTYTVTDRFVKGFNRDFSILQAVGFAVMKISSFQDGGKILVRLIFNFQGCSKG
jgi:hypothetical protein